ncbi:MAG TPA: ABC transporter permease, partial [Methylophilus sp.]
MNILTFTLAWQQLKANWKAGDLRVLLMALVLAIAAITAVGGFSQRISANLYSQGSVLLGGDLAVFSDHTLPATYAEYAKSLKLSVAQTAEFPSMVFVDDNNQLAEIKALGDGFPLRGEFAVQTSTTQTATITKQGPAKGEVWLEPRLVSALGLQIGDAVEVGAVSFKIAGVIQTEPSRGGDMFSFAPRLMMHLQDVAGTELIQYGSRVKYQLVVAGNAGAVAQFSAWLQPQLQRGERLEDVKTARPEIKSAIEKAEIFLGLS